MQERCGVDELDEGSRFDVHMGPMPAGTASQYDEEWAQPLAAAGDDVVGDLVHQRNRALQARADHLVDGNEVRLDERAYFFQCHYRTDLGHGHASYPTRGPRRMDQRSWKDRKKGRAAGIGASWTRGAAV